MGSTRFLAVMAMTGLVVSVGACASEPAAEETGIGASDLSNIPTDQLYYWDENGSRTPLSEIIHTDNLYACLEDACIGEGYLAWMAAAWVISVGSAWYVTNNQQRVGPFKSEAAAEQVVHRAQATTAKKKKKYLCTAKCQANGAKSGAYYVQGESPADCRSATLAAKAKVPSGEYPRHCSCVDTTGYRGVGEQCEQHVR